MAEYSRFATGSFTSTGSAQTIYLPFQPSRVKFKNYTVANSAATSQAIASAFWDAKMGQGYAIIEGYNATPTLIYDTVTLGGISTFAAGLDFQFGAQQQISGITKASPAVVTTASAHGYSTGDIVMFEGLYQSAPTTGMPQICGIPFQITVTSSTTFTIPWNTNQSNYTALSASPTGAYVKKVLYPFLYVPGVSFITAITTGNTTVINTTAPHNLSQGSEVAFRIPSNWGTTQLNSLPNTVIPGSPIYGYVSVVNSATQVTVTINSSSFTAFNSNQPVAGVAGQQFPQMIAVGDINSGALQYSGGALYPSPVVNGVSTINGPAIQGAFINNTRQGFVIGAGAGTVLTTGSLVGASGNVIYWEAYLPDLIT